jgi:hypothetical protein
MTIYGTGYKSYSLESVNCSLENHNNCSGKTSRNQPIGSFSDSPMQVDCSCNCHNN